MKKFFILLLCLAVALGIGGAVAANAADEVPGSSPENPIVVDSLEDIPAEAALSAVLNDDCSTTTTGVLTVPGNEETTHQEFQFKRDIPGVDEVSHQEYRVARDIPAVEEGSHQEYRFSIDRRTFTPGQDEVSHQEYKYKKLVQDYKTQYKGEYQKYVKGDVRKKGSGQDLGDFGFEQWGPGGIWGGSGSFNETNWSDSTPPALNGSGGHNDTSSEYELPNGTKVYKQSTAYQYQLINVLTRQVENGSHYEYSDWTTEVRGAPWVKIDERKVVDSAAVPASFGPWVFDHFTDWSLLNDEPADPDAQSGEDNFLNLLRVAAGSLESKKVVTQEAIPGYTEYYVLGGDPVLNLGDATWLLASQGPGAPWYNVDERTVVDSLAVEGYTEYYVLGGDPSTNVEDASWILAEQAPEGWTQFNERTVSNEDGTPEVTTYYSYNDGVECEKPEEPPVDNPPPVKNPPVKHDEPEVPVLIDAGL